MANVTYRAFKINVVHTQREDCIRIISARKATKYEQRIDFGLPVAKIKVRIDSDVLAWFKSQGRGYQTQIN